MSHSLSKRIILSPSQLQRLLGRDRELTSRTDAARQTALRSAAKDSASIGPSQAYARYREMQQRHLVQAAEERGAPLELVVSEPEPRKHSEGPIKPPEEPESKPESPKASVIPKKPPSATKKKARTSQIRKTAERVYEEISGSTPKIPKSMPMRRIVHDPRHSPVKTRSKNLQKSTRGTPSSSSSSSWLRYGKN
ncbi:uncharacterized protein LOC117651042 isoform X2 [Thrips palmi]|uniref:Uncharacterized protein LOC117651042 isoform X2 n=1 Tax=Thrips palmi TaxID=161013 RepID=A0A6P8ZZQ5_THRPL|nr:uncharacterized protein LOC117651042 isoform X2 [Thrips palmi]